MLLFRSDYSLPTALLGLSLMLGYYGGYLPHHSVMTGVLFGAAGFVGGIAVFAIVILLAKLLGITLRAAVQWCKRRLHPRPNEQ